MRHPTPMTTWMCASLLIFVVFRCHTHSLHISHGSRCPSVCLMVPVHTVTFWIYTRRLLGRTHWEEGWKEGEVRRVTVSSANHETAHVELSRASERFTERNPWFLPISGLRTGREQHVPESSNHSLCLIKLFSFSNLDGNSGGNQHTQHTVTNTKTLHNTHNTHIHTNPHTHHSPPLPSPLPHAHAHANAHVHACVYVHARVYVYVYVNAFVIVYVNVYVYVHVYVFVYVYVYVYVFVLDTAARSKKNMTPLWKVTSIYIFHSEGQHSCKRWNWRRT